LPEARFPEKILDSMEEGIHLVADHHLIQRMVYIGLNMVREGVITHPSAWPFSGGYNEIQSLILPMKVQESFRDLLGD
jgi:hypothetical protein